MAWRGEAVRVRVRVRVRGAGCGVRVQMSAIGWGALLTVRNDEAFRSRPTIERSDRLVGLPDPRLYGTKR